MAAPTQTAILPICCVCGLVRDDAGSSRSETWVTKHVFRENHGVDHSAFRLSHTYCPTCYLQFMNRIAAA